MKWNLKTKDMIMKPDFSNSVQADFNFHPIGQGCFYTGKLSFNKMAKVKNNESVILYEATTIKDFNFVYDCGTDNEQKFLKPEVESYKNGLKNLGAENSGYLDLLIISHFHEDHISGVSNLLKNLYCRRLIIPYYKTIERLLLYAFSKKENDDYRRMLQDPVGYFSGPEFNIGSITIVGGPEGPPTDEINNIVPPEGINLKNMSFPETEEKLEFHDNRRNKDIDKKLFKAIKKGEIESKNENWSNVTYFNSPYLLSIGTGIWEFYFYLQEMDNIVLQTRFENDVDLLLKKYKISIFEIFDKKYIKNLRTLYEGINKDLNVTSLVLYHGPLFIYENLRTDTLEDKKKIYITDNLKPGTIMTGDISIFSDDELNSLVKYYRKYIDLVFVFQVPHHGSKDNWNFDHDNSLENFAFYIINHRFKINKHPSKSVIKDIKKNCMGSIIQNTEYFKFSYFFNFY